MVSSHKDGQYVDQLSCCWTKSLTPTIKESSWFREGQPLVGWLQGRDITVEVIVEQRSLVYANQESEQGSSTREEGTRDQRPDIDPKVTSPQPTQTYS